MFHDEIQATFQYVNISRFHDVYYYFTSRFVVYWYVLVQFFFHFIVFHNLYATTAERDVHESATDFVEKRTAFMDEKTKLAVFLHLQTLAKSSENPMEHLILSERMRTKLASEEFNAVDSSFKSILAYLILVGININQQRVKAIAANYRAAAARNAKPAHY